MTDVRAENTVSDIGSIRASRSDLSISSPRAESCATTSTCFVDVTNRRDLGSELMCPICDQLFEKPVLVACGHSFCEPCIERRCRNTRECFICHKDVGDFSSMIPSITLENIVRKVKSQDSESLDDLFICDDKNKMERTHSTRSKKRCYFSIAEPTVCSSPNNSQRRQPLSPSAMPRKSSLKFPSSPSHNSNTSVVSEICESDGILAGHSTVFKRNSFGRRSERFTSSTRANINVVNNTEALNLSDEKRFKRNSIIRRSWNAIRHKTSSRRTFTQIMEESDEDDGEVIIHEEGDPIQENEKKKKQKLAKSLWHKFFVSKKGKVGDRKKANNSLTITRQNLEKMNSEFARMDTCVGDYTDYNGITYKMGYYSGIGKKFERVSRGEEITVVVFGHAQSGKTSFVRSIRSLFTLHDPSSPIRLITASERYSLGGITSLPYSEDDNRLPHIVSLIIDLEDGSECVLDIVDPEYDDSCLPQSYMDACDAALFIIDSRNCASLLSAHQIQRNLKNSADEHIEYEIVVNVPIESQDSRVLSKNVCENLAKTMKTTMIEMSVKNLEKHLTTNLLLRIAKNCSTYRENQLIDPKQGTIV